MDQAAVGVRTGLNLVVLFGVLAQPIIPDAAAKILEAMNIPPQFRTWDFRGENWEDSVKAVLDAVPRGHDISAPDVLFAKIEDDQVEAWKTRFGGEDG